MFRKKKLYKLEIQLVLLLEEKYKVTENLLSSLAIDKIHLDLAYAMFPCKIVKVSL